MLTLFTTDNIQTPFYDAITMFPKLEIIQKSDKIIKREIITFIQQKDEWQDWKEYNLLNRGGDWKIIPLYIAGKWAKNCKDNFPNLHRILCGIDGIKQIAISKLAPNTKLQPHCGWASYSNYHLRCHYPIVLPFDTTNRNKKRNTLEKLQSYVSVENQIEWHEYGKFILFDDARNHFAHNMSNTYCRIVLIMDFLRPNYVPIGKSTVEDTKEFIEFMNNWDVKC
jgi:aspartyl/asparaginyl beta-hydroxylase (cupin superfamily)